MEVLPIHYLPPATHSHTLLLVPQNRSHTPEDPAAETTIYLFLFFTRFEALNVENIPRQNAPPHGAHLIGLVEKAAPTPLQQELRVLVNTAARKLSGQIKSVITNTQTRLKIKT